MEESLMGVLGGAGGATLGMDVSFSTVPGMAHVGSFQPVRSLLQPELKSLPDKFYNLTCQQGQESKRCSHIPKCILSLGAHPTLACLVGLGDPRSLSLIVSPEVSATLCAAAAPNCFLWIF